jgi:hypothetical protein
VNTSHDWHVESPTEVATILVSAAAGFSLLINPDYGSIDKRNPFPEGRYAEGLRQ